MASTENAGNTALHGGKTALADLGFREQPIGRLGTFVNTLNYILTRQNPVPLQPEKNI